MSQDDRMLDYEGIYLRILDTVMDRLKTDSIEEPWNTDFYNEILDEINHIRTEHFYNLLCYQVSVENDDGFGSNCSIEEILDSQIPRLEINPEYDHEKNDGIYTNKKRSLRFREVIKHEFHKPL